MKKWIFVLCCLLAVAVVAIVVIMRNNDSAIDSLNKDLYESRTKINSLEEKAAENEKQIQNLDAQVVDLTAERDRLTADNGRLTESLESVNRNLSSSQQKLQGVLYILTDGEQGTIEGILSPFMKIFQDVGLDNPYFDAVSHVTEHKLMNPREEERFGVDEKATLGEFAEGLYAIRNQTGTQADAVKALLNTERAWLEAQESEATLEAAENPDAEPSTEEPAAEEPAAEEPAAEEPAAEEPAVEEPAADEPPADEPAAEEPAVEEPAAEEPVAEEPVAEEVPEAPAVEEPQVEQAAEATEDGTSVLTRERLLSLCKAVCRENNWTLPEIVFPESEETAANRGDLAIALALLDRIEK